MLIDPEYEEEVDTDDDEPIRFMPPNGAREWPPVKEWTDVEWTTFLQQHDGVNAPGPVWTADKISQYLHVDRYKYGLGFARTKTEKKTWFYLPIPAAIPFHASHTLNICYGGAAGGAKSHSTRYDAYRHCLVIPDFWSILMRRTHEELNRNHVLKAVGECAAINYFFDKTVMDITPSTHLLKFPETNALMTFGHCQNLGDEEKYLGPEYDEFRPDEMATFHKQQIVGVAGRLRSVNHGNFGRVLARLIGTTNPGGAFTLWIKEWFRDKICDLAENPRYKPENYEFINARLYDNPFLMDADGTFTSYEDRLYAYSRSRRRQLLNGDWSAIEGQFFEEFSDKLHVGVLDIPEGIKIECWIDWGYSPNPGVAHWVACFPNGRLYVFAEWVFNGTGRPLLVAGDVAKKIEGLTRAILTKTRTRLEKTIADPSMWAKDGHTGESYEETFRRHGVHMLKGDNDRVMGWGRMRHWLKRHPEGGAWLMYHPDCTYATRTIPGLVHSKTDPDDCDSSGEDHAADTDRYGLMGRPTPTMSKHIVVPTLPYSIREMLDQVNASAAGRPYGWVN
jgi:phage terminase large subunit